MIVFALAKIKSGENADKVTPVPFIKSPRKLLLDVPTRVIALVLADALKVPMLMFGSIVTVPAAPPLSNIAVSCASGKLLMDGVPPDEVAHAVDVQF